MIKHSQPEPKTIRRELETLYRKYNHRRYVHPDPLEFLYAFPNLEDREIVGIVSSSLAYGRVAQIIKSVTKVLRLMGVSPKAYVSCATFESMCKDFQGFYHRFATGRHLAALLFGVKHMLDRYGSLHAGFTAGLDKISDATVLPALNRFVTELTKGLPVSPEHLVPSPEKGSACKRWHLFLRWMVRKDRVDPGGWDCCPTSKLIIPLDTHMYKMGVFLKYTQRKQADLRSALEITEGFKNLSPEDPVRYDFVLTRMGIRNDLKIPLFFQKLMKSYDSVY
jgi:uncharacterized protein (TIGR02757 family)